jgi:IS5 family transposase
MKAHIGVDDQSGLVHTVVTTTAKASDMSHFVNLLHGDETRISADRGYDYPRIHAQLEEKLIEDWVARKARPGRPLDAWTRNLNHAIAQLRAVGEHPFRILKRQFGYTKVRYRGLAKNTAQLITLFALGNLYQARRALLAAG